VGTRTLQPLFPGRDVTGIDISVADGDRLLRASLSRRPFIAASSPMTHMRRLSRRTASAATIRAPRRTCPRPVFEQALAAPEIKPSTTRADIGVRAWFAPLSRSRQGTSYVLSYFVMGVANRQEKRT